MKLKKNVTGILIDEENFQIAIAKDGNMKELWYRGNLEGLKNLLGCNKLNKDDPNFAENLVDDLNSIK